MGGAVWGREGRLAMTGKRPFPIFLILLLFAFTKAAAAAEHQRVLLLLSYNATFPTFYQQIDGVRGALADRPIDLDIEFMDSKRLFDQANVASFHERLAYKLAQLPPYDLLIVADDNALHYVLAEQDGLFAGIPIVFFGINNLALAQAQAENPRVTGVVEAVSMQETLALMARLTPGVTQFFALVDDTPGGQADLKTYYEQAAQFPDVAFREISLLELTFGELALALRALPADSAVLLLSGVHDRNGALLDFADSLALVRANLSVPLYHLWYHGMGDGVLGGKLISHEAQGRAAGEMALAILDGRSPADLPIETDSPNQYVFDYNELARFGVDLAALPDEAQILNQPQTFYARYRSLVWTTGLIMSLLVVFIAILLVVNYRRRQVELALRDSHAQLTTAVTQLTSTQAQLIQQERLAAVGQLAAGIAHDFNNILGAILLYAEMVQRARDLPAALRERLSVIVQQANRGADLVQQILDFGRRAVVDLRPFDLTPFLKETVRLLQRTFPENVEISLQTGPSAYMVEADLTRLQQVVMNLAINARNAMPDGGRLLLRLYRAEGVLPCACCGETPDGAWVCLSVADTGCGIPVEALPRIFEPFYTTRAPLGSGLGLAQVHGIMKQHDGHIAVETAVGMGTTFKLYWPVRRGAGSGPADGSEPAALGAGRGETI
ncbi:MAG: hypothetical protein KC425_01040, partial [Anaerolineales bacterium]|nr:hypothetical protein [Anaerolineales bacterium]